MSDVAGLIERLGNHALAEWGELEDVLIEAATALQTLTDKVKALEVSETRAWRERNVAYAKVKAWEAIVFVEKLPLRAVRVDDWGPGEGEQTFVPEITPRKLTELLDELARLRAALTKEGKSA